MTADLSPELRAFVARWGETGRAWGLTRSAAEAHALLLAADAPLTAEEITAALGVARSNVSVSLKELRALGVIRAAPSDGRRTRFEALDDPWEAAARIALARKAREFDPAAEALADVAAAADGPAAERLSAYASLARDAGAWAEEMARLPKGPLRALMKAGAKAAEGAQAARKVKKKKKKGG